MAHIKPYKALRPVQDLAVKVASKPYDVLTSSEAKKETANNPYAFLHITKAEIDLPDNLDTHTKEVYLKAKENLQHFIANKILFVENKPCYYIYELIMNGRSQTGLVCLSSVKDYQQNCIKKHELTRPEKEKDRIDHILATMAQTGKVFLTYKEEPEIDQILQQWKNNHIPEYDFLADDYVQHIVWIINDDAVIETITLAFEQKVPATYIADGHHRAASAVKLSAQFPHLTNAQYFLTVLFPSDQLSIIDYNRLIKDLNGHSEAYFLALLSEKFEVSKSTSPVKPVQMHEFGLYLNQQWYRLSSKPNTFSNDPIGVLDVTILTNNILEPILGIKDQRTDDRIDFVGGIRGLEELKERVDNGSMQLAFSLFPVSKEQLFAVADSNQIMPPKSTWFEPKLRDGLLTHLL
ncbi:MAG: DUF1015 domain-containing protein [Niabella sp.]